MNSSPGESRYDLHCHSTASDGMLPPAEVVGRLNASLVKGMNQPAVAEMLHKQGALPTTTTGTRRFLPLLLRPVPIVVERLHDAILDPDHLLHRLSPRRRESLWITQTQDVEKIAIKEARGAG